MKKMSTGIKATVGLIGFCVLAFLSLPMILPLLVTNEGQGGGSVVRYMWFECGEVVTARAVAQHIDRNEKAMFQEVLDRTHKINREAVYTNNTASFMYGGETDGTKAGVRLYYQPWKILRFESPVLSNGKGGWYYGTSRRTDSRNEALETACRQYLEEVIPPLIKQKQSEASNN